MFAPSRSAAAKDGTTTPNKNRKAERKTKIMLKGRVIQAVIVTQLNFLCKQRQCGFALSVNRRMQSEDFLLIELMREGFKRTSCVFPNVIYLFTAQTLPLTLGSNWSQLRFQDSEE